MTPRRQSPSPMHRVHHGHLPMQVCITANCAAHILSFPSIVLAFFPNYWLACCVLAFFPKLLAGDSVLCLAACRRIHSCTAPCVRPSSLDCRETTYAPVSELSSSSERERASPRLAVVPCCLSSAPVCSSCSPYRRHLQQPPRSSSNAIRTRPSRASVL